MQKSFQQRRSAQKYNACIKVLRIQLFCTQYLELFCTYLLCQLPMPYIITELLYFLFLSNGQRHFEEKTMHYPAACYHLKSYFITYLISNVKSSSTFPGSLACSCTGVHQAPRRRLRTVANDAKCRSLDNTVAQQGKAGQWHWHLELPSKKYSKKSKLRSGREGGKMVSWS